MARRSATRLVVMVVILIAVAAASVFYIRRLKGANPTKKITIAQAGDFFLYAPLYIATDAGLFAQNGLDVELVSTGGDDKTWAAVVGKSASFGVADPTFIAVSASRGEPGRVVASIVNGVPFWGITNNRAITISSPKELAPYMVATFPSPSTAYTLQRKMFADAGLPPNIREGAFGTLLSMLGAGQADIALELEPNVSQAVLGGSKVVYSMPEMYGDFAITGLTVTPKLIAEDPELVQSVVCSLQLALDFIRSNRPQTLAFLKARFPEIKPEVAEAALQRVLAENIIPPTSVTGDKAWEKAINLRVEAGDLKGAPASSYDSLLDNTFATNALSNCRLGSQ